MSTKREPVTIGQARVAGADTILYALGLGSCVAVVLYDSTRRLGGMAHALLPQPANGAPPATPGRYVSTAVDTLIRAMEEAGASRRSLRARLAGGASMFDAAVGGEARQLGMRNVLAARTALARAGIPVDREDVGGGHGRSVYLHVAEGRVVISALAQDDVVL
ncbi:MAG: chemotaxis protein CheD [Gemmatimonadota bacterium]|jgi:chemotaxis protein CheD